jgi:hypothetical protein
MAVKALNVCAATNVFSAATAGGKVGVGPPGVIDGVNDSVGSGVGVIGAALQPARTMTISALALSRRMKDARFSMLSSL